jgi:hypothetical protein
MMTHHVDHRAVLMGMRGSQGEPLHPQCLTVVPVMVSVMGSIMG